MATNDNFDNGDIGKAEVVVKTTTTSDTHVGVGTIKTTIKN